MAESSILGVYDGRHRLGSIRQQNGRHVATGADGARIGAFATQREAMQAIPPRREVQS